MKVLMPLTAMPVAREAFQTEEAPAGTPRSVAARSSARPDTLSERTMMPTQVGVQVEDQLEGLYEALGEWCP